MTRHDSGRNTLPPLGAWLAAALLAVAVPAGSVHAAPTKDRQSREVREALKTAFRYLQANPARRADFLPPGFSIDEVRDEIIISYRTREGAERTTRLNSIEHGLINLGSSIRGWENRDNLVRLYTRLHDLLPPEYRTGLALPGQIAARSLPQVQRAYGSLLQRVSINFGDIVNILTPASFITRVTNPIGTCSAEVGFETAGDDSEQSARCEIGEYAVDGLMRNFAFPLEDNLTCVRQQGARGSCPAFASVATVESLAMVRGDAPATLSEQHFYYRGETSGDALASLYQMQVQGLSTHLALEAHVTAGFGIHYEQDWNYNRSPDLGAAELDPNLGVITYPDSCGAYNGESCSDFVYQTTTSVNFPGVPEPGAPPPMPAAAYQIASNSYLPLGPPDVTEGALQTAVMLLAGDVPLILNLFVTLAFSASTDGYVRVVPGDPADGGHVMELVGFVPNDALPATISPASEEGYFIAKNSWGIATGDCGFLYLDFGYVRKHADYLSIIDIR